MVRVRSPTEAMLFRRRTFESMQNGFRRTWTSTRHETHMFCRLPRQRHLLCDSLHQPRRILSLLSGVVLHCMVCSIAANHGLGIVTVSPPANSCRQLVKQQFHPACQSHLSAIVSSIAILRFLISNRKALLLYASYTPLQWVPTENHQNDVSPTSLKRRPFSPTGACQSSVQRMVLVPPNSSCTIVGVFECSGQE